MKLIYCFFIFYLFHLCTNQELKCKTSFDPITVMDCSFMNLTTLHPNILHVKEHTNVKKLLISYNQLNSSISFKDWNKLIALDLSHNNVNEIKAETFGTLTDLKLLNISYNNISVINENVFKNLTILEILDLSGNPLLGTKYELIKGSLNSIFFSSLKKFVMTSSNISTLPQDAFLSARELQYLDLSENNLNLIPVLPEKLIYFKASNNSINSIDIVPFQKTEHLKDLYLDNNVLLNDIDIDAFESLKNLRNVSFKGCKKLEYLPSRLFDFSKNIQFLSLADCNFKTLPHNYKFIFTKIPILELHNNPWVCNASIKWFIFTETYQDPNLRCDVPSNVTIAEYYGTSLHHSALRKILIGLVFVVFILFGLAIYISFSIEKKRRTDMPYVPLEGKSPFLNNVYVTTVV